MAILAKSPAESAIIAWPDKTQENLLLCRKDVMGKLIFLLIFVASYSAHSQGNDPFGKAAFDGSLNQTQDMLKNREERKKVISESVNAQKANSQVEKLAPDAATQDEYYKLSAEILENYRSAKDEPGMKKSLEDGQRDPATFYRNLTPEQKEKIKRLSEKLNPGAQSSP